MKFSQSFFLILTIIFAPVLTNDDSTWEEYKQDFDKTYATQKEETLRHSIFQKNLIKIQNHNSLYDEGKVSYKLGVTALTDLSEAEFLRRLGKNRGVIEPKYEVNELKLPPNLKLKPSVDWRDVEGVVPEVPDTTVCDAAWAVTTVASIEAMNIIQNDNHTKLSVQELVDCADFGEFNSGCDGGYVDNAFDYIINNGLNLNVTYPWLGETESICAYYGDGEGKFRIAGVKTVANYFQNLEMALAYIGPMVAHVDARFIQNYNGSDVFYSEDCLEVKSETITHPVLVVGYSSLSTDGYWIVRNSWGTSWGDEAFIGPVVALMDARFIQNYNGSYIFSSDDCFAANVTTINHPVLVVGYDGLNGDGHWIIRNSWGTSWGDEGYLKLTKDTTRDCGITTKVLYPVLD